MWTSLSFSSIFGLLSMSDNTDKGEIKLEKYEGFRQLSRTK